MIKETFKKNKNKILISLISVILACTTCIFATVFHTLKNELTYVTVLLESLIPFGVCLILSLLKKEISYQLVISTVIFAYLAIDMGNGYNLYNTTTYYDLVMHGGFGVLAVFYLQEFLVKLNNGPYWKNALIIILCVLGIASCWEIMEYIVDLIFHQDAQDVNISIAQNKSPVADTMEDIIISGITSTVTLIIEYIIFKVKNKNALKIEENENNQ